MNYFNYTQEELDFLKAKDETFARYIDEIGTKEKDAFKLLLVH